MAKKRRQYGSGQMFQRGKLWHIRYCDGHGNRQSESTGSVSKQAAIDLLKKRLGGSTGKPKPTGQTIGDCFKLLIADYELRQCAEIDIAKLRMDSHLKALAGIVAASFTTEDAEDYIKERRKAKAANATINRELSIVRTSLKLAAKQKKPWIGAVPPIPVLPETNVRIGFVSQEQINLVKDRLPEYLKPLLVVASLTGLRRGSLLKIRLDQVDLADGIITLEGRQVKNRTGHHVPIFEGEMQGWCKLAVQTHRAFLFEHEGRQIRSFKNAWNAAVVSAGLPWLRFHDLRRTGVRNLIRAGVPEEIVMAISGHKTRSMLQRYNIVTVDDVKAAAKRFKEASTGTQLAQPKQPS